MTADELRAEVERIISDLQNPNSDLMLSGAVAAIVGIIREKVAEERTLVAPLRLAVIDFLVTVKADSFTMDEKKATIGPLLDGVAKALREYNLAIHTAPPGEEG